MKKENMCMFSFFFGTIMIINTTYHLIYGSDTFTEISTFFRMFNQYVSQDPLLYSDDERREYIYIRYKEKKLVYLRTDPTIVVITKLLKS